MNHRQEYLYNSRGQNTEVHDANNSTSHADYDALGNITKLTGPMGSLINYTYDEMGRLISETTSSGGSISYGYNELNIKEQLTNARGQKRKYFHDATGRITGFVGAEDSVSYTYDANGNVLTVTDSNGTVKREYDGMTTTHLIHPDNWRPYAPSGIKRKDISIWQYGKDCHPIDDDKDTETSFNINLVRNEKVIIEKMF